MIQEIINKYQTNSSIESLSKEFKIGKLKIKKILYDNNIPIKKKGGQIKYKSIEKVEHKDSMIKCKICSKEFNDIDNKSGAITNHIKECYPDVIIPTAFKRRMYLKNTGDHWHLNYFDLVRQRNFQTIKCSECDWETKDIQNKTGALTKHIELNHSTITDYLLKYPLDSHLFASYNQSLERSILFENDNNFVTCQICGEQFKTISNTHLLLHNTSTNDYKRKFGEDSLISHTSKIIFSDNLKNCTTNHTYRSKSEIEIEEFLISLGVDVIHCDKKQLSGVEIDLYLPQYKIGIEYNGLYWHSENRGKHKNYHIDKTLKCLSNDIKLIHIFSDEWISKKNVIKNRLINLLNKNENKLFARKCKIVELSKEEKNKYLNENHLQGNDKSSIYLGLSHNDKIVSVMTFGKLRNVLGNQSKNEGEYELYRFCSENVIGGFTKLLNYFVKNYSPKKIITYANRNWSPSDKFCFYSNVGFNYVGITKPNYTYTKRYEVREHRFNYRKDRLVKMGYDKNKTENQIMFELGYDKIWDTGNLKYEIIF
jgi:hypothetical protein